MIVVLFGPPGVGKGTQASRLAKHFNFEKFSMGDILREEVAIRSESGKKAEVYMSQGVLVPDMLIFEIVDNFLLANKDTSILFDGFPRNLNQAISLNTSLSRLGLKPRLALDMDLAEKEIIARLVNRRYCPACNRLYNLVSNPPAKNEICNQCGKPLIKRPDDHEAVIQKRLQVYRDETAPLTRYYKSMNCYQKINAIGSEDEIFNNIVQIINAHNTKK